jgi:DNA-binding IclR family transcriptional regulator
MKKLDGDNPSASLPHVENISKDMEGEPRAGTQSLERGVALLGVLATHQHRGLSLSDVARLSGLGVSTTQRLLKALHRLRLAERDADKRYRLGMLTFELGLAAGTKMPHIDAMRPVLQLVAERTGDTAYLVARSGDETVCLLREQGHFPIRTMIMDVGSRRPLGLGGGSLHLLSHHDDDEVRRVIARNAEHYPRFHHVDAQILHFAVQEARKRGYGLSHGRLTEGVSAVGIAVPTPDGLPVLAIGIACISTRMDEDHCRKAVRILREAVGTA